MPDITVIILTYNEGKNISQALDSVHDWAAATFILDSFSTDDTLQVAGGYRCAIFQNSFESYSKQRNHALKKLPIETEWVFFLDADEWLSGELKDEIEALISSRPRENGYFVKRRLMWMGKWIKRGCYPTWILRLFRRGKAYCEDRSINEHLLIEGETGYLKCDLIHQDKKDVTEWIEKHNKYATLEAWELLHKSDRADHVEAGWGNQVRRKRWLRRKVWSRLPPLVRPFLYFTYRYVFAGGFLDGRPAFIYHFLQALWFPMLIDVKYMELRRRENGL